MRRLNRPPRVVALCVRGEVVRRYQGNTHRLVLLEQLTDALEERSDWHPIDVVLLPGGFFRMKRALGSSSFGERRSAVAEEPFAMAIVRSVRTLERRSPGIRIVTGVLATARDPSERTEQCSLGFGHSLEAVARKLFPTSQDVKDGRYISPYLNDYTSPRRFIRLANGSVALLSACYDLFGVADLGTKGSSRRSSIRRILTPSGPLMAGQQGFAAIRTAALAGWIGLVEAHQPDVALATIHRFRQPGMDGYWQRHGIARASAALYGALVVGAAHFQTRLPQGPTSSLAAFGVGLDHLFAGVARPACRLVPIRCHVIEGPTGTVALLRLFTPPNDPAASPGERS